MFLEGRIETTNFMQSFVFILLVGFDTADERRLLNQRIALITKYLWLFFLCALRARRAYQCGISFINSAMTMSVLIPSASPSKFNNKR